MYLYHFGLKKLPFTLTPNTQFYYQLPPHQEALQVLHTALAAGEGFIKVTGEVGTGKTMICRKLINELADKYQFAWLPNPYLNGDELRRALAAELGLPVQQDALLLTQTIGNKLMRSAMKNKPVVVVVDEAQALPNDSLEALRLFTNLETESFKLLQVVLLGQPELDHRLAQPELRQLRQRITFSYRLRGLSVDECYGYLQHRLQIAGFTQQSLFSPALTKLLWRASGGIPRLLNVLAHKSLMLGFGSGQANLDKSIVRKAIVDTEAAHQPQFWDNWPRSTPLWLALCGLLVAGVWLRFFAELAI
ncbi:ExeA family protein [Ferrimonas lipolytica]|uniref:AAA family ATPase n=1 Tax=Ferrimonas lipolytica TaxID=2724191 RepID=A0A6H1UJE5_9GAMM|nr:AAA family ATPase [Ferrimonas lipolytica]QIZ77922.1 AAA family ATPase [Ferrimonas lipolytica]